MSSDPPPNYIERHLLLNDVWPKSAKMPHCANVINAMMFMDEGLPAAEDIVKLISEEFPLHPRLVSLGDPCRGAFEALDGEVDWKAHVITHEECDGRLAVTALVNRLVLTDLPFSKPLYEFHLIPAVEAEDQCILARVHHSIADGFSMVKLFDALTRDKQGHPVVTETAKQRSNVYFWGLREVWKFLRGVIAVLGAFLKSYESKIAFLPAVSTRRYREFGPRKVILFDPLDLAGIKAVKNQHGVSVNDVMVSAMVGAVRRYSARYGELPQETVFRTLAPFGFARQGGSLQNCFGIMSANLGEVMDCKTAAERLMATHREFNRIKQSGEGPAGVWVTSKLLDLLAVPIFATQWSTRDLFSCHGMMFSNVPGPGGVRYLAGKKISAVYPVFLTAVTLAMCLSYAGSVYLSLTLDDGVVRHCDELEGMFRAELHEMGYREGGVDKADSPVEAVGLECNPDDECIPDEDSSLRQRRLSRGAGA